MLDAEWSVEEVADVTLVEVEVHNPTAVDREVRVDDRLDGPTLPPRTDGTAERGWDADGYAGVVPAGERLRLGYASPSPPVDPPVSVEDEGPAPDGERDGDADATEAVRLLGDASPPADALPSVADPEGPVADGTTAAEEATDAEVSARVGRVEAGATTDGRSEGTTGDALARPVDDGRTESRVTADDGERGGAEKVADGGASGTESDRTGDGAEPVAAGDPPTAVADWFVDVERRVDHAERLTDASVVEAATVLDERGGLAEVEALPDQVADDEAALRAVAERATALADRAAATDVPLSALRRLS